MILIDLATNPVVRNFLKELVQAHGDEPQEVADFILIKAGLPVPIAMACALFTSTKLNLRNAPISERDLVQDGYFISAIWRLLGGKIVEKRKSVETHLVLLNAL